MQRTETMMRDLEDHFRIRFENKIAIRPRREDCHLAAATRLMARKQELADLDTELQERKQWHHQHTKEIDEQRELLEIRNKALKISLVKFEKFLRENDSRRHRAIKKAADERSIQELKNLEMQNLLAKLAKLNETKNTIQKKINNNIKYQDFMEKAAEAGGPYNSMHEIIDRYDTLSVTKDYLHQREINSMDMVEIDKLKLIQFSKDRKNDILYLNNKLSELQTRYDSVKQEVINWESMWARIKTTAAKKTLMLGQVKMAIHNMYQLCNRYQRTSTQHIDQQEPEQSFNSRIQLSRVGNVLQDLTSTTAECKRLDQQAQEADAQAAY